MFRPSGSPALDHAAGTGHGPPSPTRPVPDAGGSLFFLMRRKPSEGLNADGEPRDDGHHGAIPRAAPGRIVPRPAAPVCVRRASTCPGGTAPRSPGGQANAVRMFQRMPDPRGVKAVPRERPAHGTTRHVTGRVQSGSRVPCQGRGVFFKEGRGRSGAGARGPWSTVTESWPHGTILPSTAHHSSVTRNMDRRSPRPEPRRRRDTEDAAWLQEAPERRDPEHGKRNDETSPDATRRRGFFETNLLVCKF